MRFDLGRLATYALLGFGGIQVSLAQPALLLKNAKIAVSSPDGLSDATYSLQEPTPLASPINLTESSTLKLTFTILDSATSSGLIPHQSHILFEDERGSEVILPLSVKSNGKTSFTINTAKPPKSLIATTGNLQTTLLISNLATHTPLNYPLGTIHLPSSILTVKKGRHDLPPRQGEPAFQPQQELTHTFNPGEKRVGVVKSVIGTTAALAPWGVLLGLIGKVRPELEYKGINGSGYLFLASLGALEVLIFTYWIGLKLYQLLPIFIALSLVSAYAGKVALGSIRARRIKAGGVP